MLTKKWHPPVSIIGQNGGQAFVLAISLIVFDSRYMTEFVSRIEKASITELNTLEIEIRSFDGEYLKSK